MAIQSTDLFSNADCLVCGRSSQRVPRYDFHRRVAQNLNMGEYDCYSTLKHKRYLLKHPHNTPATGQIQAFCSYSHQP